MRRKNERQIVYTRRKRRKKERLRLKEGEKGGGVKSREMGGKRVEDKKSCVKRFYSFTSYT